MARQQVRASFGGDVLLGNRLLRHLAEEDRSLLRLDATVQSFKRGDIVFHPGDLVEAAHFPIDAMISLVVSTRTGEVAETGLIGPEGAIGGLISGGNAPAFGRAVVQVQGDAIRVPVSAIARARMASGRIHDAFSRYTDCFLAQLLQTIACNARHSLDRRLPRWILSVQDRIGGEELPLTQEYLSEMLGVQRTTVTAAALVLQAAGTISYRRGVVKVLDREALERASCGCHRNVAFHYDRLLRGVYAAGAHGT